MEARKGEIILYRREDGAVQIDVRVEDQTVWLTQEQMAALFGKGRSTIAEHISHIFEEGELDENVVCRNFRQTTQQGAIEGKTQEREVKHYNLDVIISVGYRVKSVQGTYFRQWATQRLREYIIKGFVLDDDRLKNLGGANYWKELLERIRDIRSSEKVMYRQVLDLYATASDYNPKSPESIEFFKAEAMIAKNYLEEKELKVLNNLVSAYFDLAELNAIEEREMRMADFVRELDNILRTTGRNVLDNAGQISYEQAKKKAIAEYKKYKAKTLSNVEKDYLNSITMLEQKAKKANRIKQ